MRRHLGFLIGLAAAFATSCTSVAVAANPIAQGAFLPDVVRGPRSEVKLALSPDGRTLVWGVVEAGGKLLLKMSERDGASWSAAAPVPFASAKDFDPAFSPDGRWLYFFSDRPGGLGSDDLWRVPFDLRTRRFGTAENLGAEINTSGREWAPGISPDGRSLLFASDGRGGRKQELFLAPRQGSGWGTPAPIAVVNSAEDDYDGTFLSDGSLVFSRGNSDDGPVQLFYAQRSGKGFASPRKLGSEINCAEFVIGPATSSAAPGWLFISAPCPANAGTRLDIIAVPLSRALPVAP